MSNMIHVVRRKKIDKRAAAINSVYLYYMYIHQLRLLYF